MPGRSRITLKEGWIDSDTTTYFKAADDGRSVGDVIWEDTLENRLLYTDVLYFKDSTGYFEAISKELRPMFVQILDEDSLYVVSDNLKRGELSDSTGFIEAVGNVQILKSDFHAVCDSLYYSDVDSTFTLFRSPVCWADTTQISGDTIKINFERFKYSSVGCNEKCLSNHACISKLLQSDKCKENIKLSEGG